MWYKLRVGTFQLKYSPLNPIENEYSYCDSKGNILKRVSGKFEKGYFINEKTDEKHDTAFRLINNKPFAKLKKTTETDNYKEVELKEIDDLIVEKECIVFCDELLEELKESGKALKFGFTFGNGFKVYKCYAYPSKLYKGFLFMAFGTTQKSEIIKEITQELKQKKKADEITLTIQGIDRAKVEDLIVL